MILFDENTAVLLRRHICGKRVDSVLLGTYGMVIQFDGVSIHCNERVFSKIGETVYEWQDSPSSAPWGALVRQMTNEVSFSCPQRLRIGLESGDYIELETVEGLHESIVINFPREGDKLIMEIY